MCFTSKCLVLYLNQLQNASMCFHNFFTCSSSIYEYQTKHSYRGDVFLAHTNSFQYGLKSIRYIGSKMWNDLPEELRSLDVL